MAEVSSKRDSRLDCPSWLVVQISCDVVTGGVTVVMLLVNNSDAVLVGPLFESDVQLRQGEVAPIDEQRLWKDGIENTVRIAELDNDDPAQSGLADACIDQDIIEMSMSASLNCCTRP